MKTDHWHMKPDALGNPETRPKKLYCDIHHVGFYGQCPECRQEEIRELLVKILTPQPISPSVPFFNGSNVKREIVQETYSE